MYFTKRPLFYLLYWDLCTWLGVCTHD